MVSPEFGCCRSIGVKLAWLILLFCPLVDYSVQVHRRHRYPVEYLFIPPAVHALAVRWVREKASCGPSEFAVILMVYSRAVVKGRAGGTEVLLAAGAPATVPV
jgi:integral membrane sensor domain MASE1